MRDYSEYVLDPIREDAEFTLYRGRQRCNPAPVLAEAPAAEHLEHEYSLAAELEPAWAATPLGSAEILRIHKSDDGEVVLKLSGRIDEENISELQALTGAEASGQHMVLDLGDVTLVGQEGITSLAKYEGVGVTLVNSPAYVRQWITRERND